MTDETMSKGRKERREGKQEAPVLRNTEAREEGEEANTRQVDYTRLAYEVGRVRAFFERNPRLWVELCDKCERHISAGVPFGIHEVMERWRWFRPTTEDGSELRLNNSWSPIIARLLVAAYPEADKLIERRRSVYDQLFEARG